MGSASFESKLAQLALSALGTIDFFFSSIFYCNVRVDVCWLPFVNLFFTLRRKQQKLLCCAKIIDPDVAVN